MARKRRATEHAGTATSPKRRRASSSRSEIALEAALTEEDTHGALEARSPPTLANGPDATAEISKLEGRSSKHVRFDSEDADGNTAQENDNDELIEPEPPQPDRQADQEDSEDEAPDTISTSAAQRSTKASLANLAKVVSEQRAEQKRKRKERDTRLKSQSKPAKNPSKNEVKQSDDEVGQAPSPDLLPAHLLEEDFPRQRTPSPRPRSAQKVGKKLGEENSKKQKLLFRDPSPKPRDRKVGAVNVSVLQKSSPSLAPKSEEKAKALREGWLRGRRGRGGIRLVERRLVNAGFARR